MKGVSEYAMKVYDVLASGEHTIDEIARAVGLKRHTVEHIVATLTFRFADVYGHEVRVGPKTKEKIGRLK